MNRSRTWQITQSWYIIFTFIIFLHWLGIFIAGKRVHHRKWVIWGLIHSIPVGVLFLTIPGKVLAGYPFLDNILMVSFFASWFGAIIQAFMIRSEFLIMLDSRLRQIPEEMAQKSMMIKHRTEKENLIKDTIMQANELKSEIEDLLNEDTNRAVLYKGEILPMLREYSSQIDALLRHEAMLEEAKESLSRVYDEDKLQEYSEKMRRSESSQMKREYEKAYKQMLSAQTNLNNLNEQLEMCQMRIEATILSLNELKMNMILLLKSDTNADQFISEVQLKSTELKEYIILLTEDAKLKKII